MELTPTEFKARRLSLIDQVFFKYMCEHYHPDRVIEYL